MGLAEYFKIKTLTSPPAEVAYGRKFAIKSIWGMLSATKIIKIALPAFSQTSGSCKDLLNLPGSNLADRRM
jgi:hypothetical protein